jgi:APA family basic amino acid/polyamine antiporter
VVVLYLSVNWVCLRVLGATGLAATNTPAADVAKLVHGAQGTFFICTGIVVSTLGFLSQGMLTGPRVYFAMAEDGLFFRALARVHPKTHVPVAAIALQGCTAVVIALTGRYEQILNYVVSVDFIFYGLTASCLFVFRRRARANGRDAAFRVPGHPFTTLFFIASCWLVVLNSVYSQPVNSLIGLAIMATGLPAYLFWKRSQEKLIAAKNLTY